MHTWPCLLFIGAREGSALFHLENGARSGPLRSQGYLCPALGFEDTLLHSSLVHGLPRGPRELTVESHTAEVLLDETMKKREDPQAIANAETRGGTCQGPSSELGRCSVGKVLGTKA